MVLKQLIFSLKKKKNIFEKCYQSLYDFSFKLVIDIIILLLLTTYQIFLYKDFIFFLLS